MKMERRCENHNAAAGQMALPLFETTNQGHGFKLTSTNLAIQEK